MTTDRNALDPKLWDDIRATGIVVDVRKGDIGDPLAGVVRFIGPESIDLIVAKYKWQQADEQRQRLAVMRVDVLYERTFGGGE